ncbi:MAG: hypothetical protein EOM25_12895 [Deltaproteobacteria bacterium]|nr:hypothetical protein [Deltaproteobacteria bacterium]
MEKPMFGATISRFFGLFKAKTLFLCLGFILFSILPAVAEQLEPDKFFSSTTIALPDGTILERSIIAGPPHPPIGFERRTLRALPEPNPSAGVNVISDVPAYTWCFGCSATSAAMIAGYYDRNGYPNMYAGPSNGGVAPLNNDEFWTTWVDGCLEPRNRCPLSATQMGLDGRATRGHVDDYWICYGNPGPDPFVVNGWTEHVKGDCTADFMGTNQASSPIENSDGATTFWNYNDGRPLTAQQLFDSGPDDYERSGLCGIVEFYESRGYSVTQAYNQYIHPYGSNTQGFTFAQFKAEIDAGRPVMFHVTGHTMVGVGYDDSTSTIYLHDTWDHSQHAMTWGGSYSGMTQYAVTIVVLDSPPPPSPTKSLPWLNILLLD